jgi:Rrf2 family protein
MFKLNRKMEYALMALAALKNENKALSAKDLATMNHLPFGVLSKVLQKMKAFAIVESSQGVSGGYFLAKPLEKISLYDLNVALNGQAEVVKCLATGAECELSNGCQILKPAEALNKLTLDFSKSVNLKAIFDTEPSINRVELR